MKILPIKTQLTLSIVGIMLVLVLGYGVNDSGFDAQLSYEMNSLNTGVIGASANFIYQAFQPLYAAIMCAVGIVLYLVFRQPWQRLVAFAVTVLVAWFPVIMLKKVFERPRIDFATLPNPPDYWPADYAYPSGHTAFIVGLCVALLLATYHTKTQGIVRILAPIPMILIVLCVTIIGVHYPTDALGSVIWVFSVAPLAWLAMSRLLGVKDEQPESTKRPEHKAQPAK